MINLVLITSVINICNKPLSYTNIRSIYSTEERFEQTKKTIQSIKEKIPNYKILLVECSNLTEDMKKYLQENCDYFINYYDNLLIRQQVEGISKSLGEGIMTIEAIDYIINNKIEYNNLIKISGRYWLSEKFNYESLNNNNIVIKYIDNNLYNCFTALYQLPKNIVELFGVFLKNNIINMEQCIGYEVLFARFIHCFDNKIIINPFGLSGFVSVSNDVYNG